MDFTGKVIQDLPMEGGTSKAGREWKKKGWILETISQYPRKVKIDAFGARVDTIHLELGKTYNVSVDAESREFNGRWYTDITVYAAHEVQDGQFAGQPSAAAAQNPFASQAAPAVGAPAADPFAGSGTDPFASPGDTSDDLPF